MSDKIKIRSRQDHALVAYADSKIDEHYTRWDDDLKVRIDYPCPHWEEVPDPPQPENVTGKCDLIDIDGSQAVSYMGNHLLTLLSCDVSSGFSLAQREMYDIDNDFADAIHHALKRFFTEDESFKFRKTKQSALKIQLTKETTP